MILIQVAFHRKGIAMIAFSSGAGFLMAELTLILAAAAICGWHRRPNLHRACATSSENLELCLTKKLEKGLDRLDTSAEQRSAVSGIQARLFPGFSNIQTAREKIYAAFAEQLVGNEIDAATLHGLVGDEAKRQKKFGHALADAMERLHALFTPDQRKLPA